MSKPEVAFAFEINGEQINPGEIKDSEITLKIEAIVESVAGKVGGISCPDHMEAPRFICSGPDFDNLSLEVLGCCDKLVDIVKGGLASD